VKITFHFESQLRQAAGAGQVTVSVPDGCCVSDALQLLAQQLGPSLAERLVAADGTPLRSVLVFVNDRTIAQGSAASHTLKAGDTVLLYPPISGG
jgi:molybdopterin converting factor small subunit